MDRGAPIAPNQRLAVPKLGLGLIGIGREWGGGDRSIASEQQADELLREALALKISFWDTAASYGHSEARLGRFLRGLSAEERRGLRIATKFGEYWVDGAAVVDHTYDALCRSLDRSLELLGAIDLLQIHKCTSPVLASHDVKRAIQYARGLGVRSIGASVSDVKSCEMAAAAEFVDVVQLPLNWRRPEWVAAARSVRALGKRVIANRPMDSGALLAGASENQRSVILRECFSFVAQQDAADTILTGTRSASHLRDNYRAFTLALADADPSLRARG